MVAQIEGMTVAQLTIAVFISGSNSRKNLDIAADTKAQTGA